MKEDNNRESTKSFIKTPQNFKGRLPLIDKITYGPIKKYTAYNRFPWKLIIHILLLFVVTTQIILVIDSSGGYSRSEISFFYRMFLSDDLDYNEVDYEVTRYFYELQDVKDFVSDTLDKYYGIEDSESLEKYYIPRVTNSTGSENPIDVDLDIFYRRGHHRRNQQNISYSINPSDLGPFEYEKDKFRELLSNSTHFRLAYKLDNIVPSINIDSSDCYHWSIYQDFDFTQRNILVLTVQTTRQFCASEYNEGNFWSRYIWIHILSLTLAAVSLVLNLKY